MRRGEAGSTQITLTLKKGIIASSFISTEVSEVYTTTYIKNLTCPQDLTSNHNPRVLGGCVNPRGIAICSVDCFEQICCLLGGLFQPQKPPYMIFGLF